MRRVQILLPLLILLALPASAGIGRWTPWGPGGGSARALAVDPSDPQLVLAVTDGGVYRSADAGASWSWVASSGGCCSGAVAFDPVRPWRVLAGGHGALRLSEDRGRTWTEVLAGDDLYAQHIAFAGRSTVFAAEKGSRLQWSRDGGRTWEVNPLERTGVISLATDPRRPERVYALLFEGLWESRDGGLTWSGAYDPDRFFPPLPGHPGSYDYGLAVATAPSRPDTVYVAKDLAFFRSVDGGHGWKRFPPPAPPSPYWLLRLAVDPREPSTVYAATAAGVRVSRDGGATWSSVNQGLPPFDAQGHLGVADIAVDPTRPGVLYAGLAGAFGQGMVQDLGIARSWNGGRRWSLGIQDGLAAARFGLVRAGERGVYYVTLNPIGLDFRFARAFRTDDDGRTWVPVAEAIAGQGINDMAVDPAAPDVLYAATDEGVWKSFDGGVRWQRVVRAGAVVLATPSHGTVLAAGPCGLRRSADGGRTWTQALPCQSTGEVFLYLIERLRAAPAGAPEIYAEVTEVLSPHGNSRPTVYRSRDHGATWNRVAEGSMAAVSPSRPATVYVQALKPEGLELLRSDDHGETWRTAGSLDLPLADLIVDPRNPEILYGAVQQHGVWRSRDGGATWEPLNVGLTRPGRLDVRVLTWDPWQPDRFFVLPWDGGGLFVASFPG
jgi:photosystem II stability/assembly factor-like uncharacterized protein